MLNKKSHCAIQTQSSPYRLNKMISPKNAWQNDFRTLMESLFIKKAELRKKAENESFKNPGRYLKAYGCAKTLFEQLNTLEAQLSEARLNTHSFKEQCKHVLEWAKPELSKHRGWGVILGVINDLLNTLTGKLRNHYFFESAKTKSNVLLEGLENCVGNIEEIEPEPVPLQPQTL